VGAQGFSPAKNPANTRGFSPGPSLHKPQSDFFSTSSYAFLSSASNAKNLSSPKADNPSNINKIHLQMSFTCFAKLVLENKKSPGADRVLPF
jgi:hypothetical protein